MFSQNGLATIPQHICFNREDPIDEDVRIKKRLEVAQAMYTAGKIDGHPGSP
jgi:hypothetical protein